MVLLVTGATGLVGGEAARLLGAEGRSVRALVRDPRRAARLQQAGIGLVAGDLDDPVSLRQAVQGIDAVLLVSPATPHMVRQQCNLIDALAALAGPGAGARDEGDARRSGPPGPRIVKISGFMTAPDAHSQSGRWHALIEAHIAARGLRATCLRPPFFMQNLLGLGPHAAGSGEIAVPVTTGRIAMVDARDLAAVAVRCLCDRGHDGRCYLVTGPQAVSFAEVAAQLSEVLGRPIRHRYIDPHEMRRRLEAVHTPPWRIAVLLEFYAGFEAGHAAALSSSVADITGCTPRSLKQFITEHRNALNTPA